MLFMMADYDDAYAVWNFAGKKCSLASIPFDPANKLLTQNERRFPGIQFMLPPLHFLIGNISARRRQGIEQLGGKRGALCV